jgi:hypothetical protein
MIKKSEVMELLLNACPSYKDRWQDYFQFNYSNGEEQLLYIDLGDFAEHLVDLYRKYEIHEFVQVFDVIEQLHIDGDEYVKEAATIGLLEGIQNIASNSNINLEGFRMGLKPISKKWWDNLNDFWSGKTEYVGGPYKEH